MTSDYLYVNPDGLDKISGPYDDAAENFVRLSGYLGDLRARYADAWGNDDLGQKVSPQVQQALQGLQDRVDSLGRALGVYGEGLRTTSKAYRDADDNATDAADQFHRRQERVAVEMPPALPPGGDGAGDRKEWKRGLVGRGELRRAAVVPGELQRGVVVPGELLRPVRSERPAETTERSQLRRLLRPGEEGYVEPPADRAFIPATTVEPLQPTHQLRRLAEPGEEGYVEPPTDHASIPELEPRQFGVRLARTSAAPLEPTRVALRHEYAQLEPAIPAEPLEPVVGDRHDESGVLLPRIPAIPAERVEVEPPTEA
ncbi:MAG TPA: hypothetical protein VGP57_24090 [Actinoplanes sp.]|nr:hypothetical protein [Actinoplanes sp.]